MIATCTVPDNCK